MYVFTDTQLLRFYWHSLLGRPSGGVVFLFLVFTGILFSERPPVAPSFVARRKIGEKGVSRGCGPLNPRGNVLGHSDVLCANRLAMVRVTRLRRLRRCRLSPCLCVLRCQGHGTAYDFTGQCSKHESVETVCLHTPRAGLNRVNCTNANS